MGDKGGEGTSLRGQWGRSPACDNVEYIRRPSKGDPKCIDIEKMGISSEPS